MLSQTLMFFYEVTCNVCSLKKYKYNFIIELSDNLMFTSSDIMTPPHPELSLSASVSFFPELICFQKVAELQQ